MKIVIFGDTPFAECLCHYISEERESEVIAFTQQKEYITRSDIDGKRVIPFEELHNLSQDFSILLGIGYSRMNTLRERIYNLCKDAGFSIATYVSKKAHVYTNEIGEGTFVAPCAFVGQNCVIGKCNFLMESSVLAHDDTVGNFNYFSVASVLAGNVRVEDNCFIGANATIINRIEIKKQTLVGAGSVVIKTKNHRYNGGGYLSETLPAVSRERRVSVFKYSFCSRRFLFAAK